MVGVILGLLVMLGFFVGLHVFEFLVSFENARKVSEYPLVAKDITDNQAALMASIIKEAEVDCMDRNKKTNLINPKNEAEKKNAKQFLQKILSLKKPRNRLNLLLLSVRIIGFSPQDISDLRIPALPTLKPMSICTIKALAKLQVMQR